MAHDVFISYSQGDKQVADAMCATLESRRIRCWIAPRDILPGTEYGVDVIRGIEECRIFVVVFSAGANESPHVRREVERAVSKGRVVVPFRIEAVSPSRAMEYCLSNTHWLDALTPPLEAHLGRLACTIERLLEDRPGPSTVSDAPGIPPPASSSAEEREFVSPTRLFGMPLMHVVTGVRRADGSPSVARGILAVGPRAVGLVALGSVLGVGLISVGRISIGLLSFGFLSLGVFSAGAFAVALVAAWGVIALAPVAMGLVAVGYCVSGFAAWGRHARDHVVHSESADLVFRHWAGPWFHGILTFLCCLAVLLIDFAGSVSAWLLRRSARRRPRRG